MAIKLLDPKAIFKVISATDDALLSETAEELLAASTNADGSAVANPTRYEQYMEEANFDESKLIFKEGCKPDRFVLRPLTADEHADINSKYIFVDTVGKKMVYTNRHKMFLEFFKLSYQGIETGAGVQTKPALAELPYPIQVEMGAVVSLIASLDKNAKKP